MAKHVDLYSSYRDFSKQVLEDIRKETFGDDIGQNSWLTVDEYDLFIDWLKISPGHHVLEVASGSGGPAIYLANKMNCRVTGIDVNENGINEAALNAGKLDKTHQVSFKHADANERLPFEDSSFDGIVCIDSVNHFRDRLSVLREWYRVLHSGGRAVFTDPVVITGPVTSDELALRSSIGFFLFVPPGINEQLIEKAGFHIVGKEDVTENAALVSGRWYLARQRHKEALQKIEGPERYEGLQKFFNSVHLLTTERRLSRIVYLVEK